MSKSIRNLLRWIPALCVMISIFLFSAQSSFVLPDFGWADYLMKKAGHVVGYALLSLSFLYAFDWKKDKRRLAWVLAVIYAMTDEIHQSYVPGRHPSVWDVLIFDNFGSLISIWFAGWWLKQR